MYQAAWRIRLNQASSRKLRRYGVTGLRAARSARTTPDAANLLPDVDQAGWRAGATVDRVVLGGDEAGAVGPADLLAEEAALGRAVAVADHRGRAVSQAQLALLAESQAELDVLGSGHAGVEGADVLEDRSAVRRVGGDRVGRVRVDRVALPCPEHPGGLALGDRVAGGVLELARDAADLGVREGGDELAKPFGRGEAVAVDEREDLSPALGDAAVAGIRDAGDGLVEVGDRVAADLGGGPVGRAVVDDDDLPALRRELAGEDRGDRVADHRLAVADGDDDRCEGGLGAQEPEGTGWSPWRTSAAARSVRSCSDSA